MFKPLIIGLTFVTLTGCANNNYSSYLEAQSQIELAKANAEAERYKAMSEIAKYGDTTTQVAAMMALQQRGTTPNQTSNIRAPKSISEELLKWGSVLVPSVTQLYGLAANRDISINNSNNNRDIQISNAEQRTAATSAMVDGFVGISQEIQAPAANYVYTDSGNTSYADSNNSYADSYNTPTDSYNAFTSSYNTDDNSDNSDNSVTNPSLTGN